jgi:hypothetical protein
MHPHPRQPGQPVFILSELNLKLSFTRMSMLRENIENKRRAIQNFYTFAENSLQVALLCRGKLFIKDNRSRLFPKSLLLNLSYFTPSDKSDRMRLL